MFLTRSFRGILCAYGISSSNISEDPFLSAFPTQTPVCSYREKFNYQKIEMCVWFRNISIIWILRSIQQSLLLCNNSPTHAQWKWDSFLLPITTESLGCASKLVTSIFSASTRTSLQVLIWALLSSFWVSCTAGLGLAPAQHARCVLESRKRTLFHVLSKVICYFLPQRWGSSKAYIFFEAGRRSTWQERKDINRRSIS